jgi:Ca-activated chloride channel homolog
MSKKTVLSSGFVRGAAGALSILVIAAGAGLVPVAGLTQPVSPVDPVSPIIPREGPVTCIDQVTVTPRSGGSAKGSGVTLNASLGQSKIVRGGDGTVYLHCDVRVSDAPRDVTRQPIDLALVLDTSGSMASAMPLLKRATLGIVERMNPEDRLTVVTYSNSARVIYQGPVTGPGMAQLESAVAALVASGGTNISAGIQAGVNALGARLSPSRCGTGIARGGCVPPRPAAATHAKRVLLLTDGLANQGIVDGTGLGRLVTSLRGRGVALSAMGLGASYNEQLLGSLADSGGGRYHFVDRPEGLAAVYAAEVDALRSLVARGATLTVTPKTGTVVEQVVSWSSSRVGNATRVQLGDLEQGRSLKVVLRLRLPTHGGSEGSLLEAADVTLSFVDTERQVPASLSVASLNVAMTTDALAAAASCDAEVTAAVKEIEVAQFLQKARVEAKAGRQAEARRMVMEIKKVTGKSKLSFAAPSGAMEELELDDLADGIAEGESSTRGRRAMKMSDAAARSTAR